MPLKTSCRLRWAGTRTPNKAFRGDYQASSTKGLMNYGAHAPAVKRLIDP